jgi:hypothetical protein
MGVQSHYCIEADSAHLGSLPPRTVLDTNPFSDPVELQDVIDAAKRLKKKPDANWS